MNQVFNWKRLRIERHRGKIMPARGAPVYFRVLARRHLSMEATYIISGRIPGSDEDGSDEDTTMEVVAMSPAEAVAEFKRRLYEGLDEDSPSIIHDRFKGEFDEDDPHPAYLTSMHYHYEGVLQRAVKGILDNWEDGDLAGAVRWAEEVLTTSLAAKGKTLAAVLESLDSGGTSK
jgi:hypothetical protein